MSQKTPFMNSHQTSQSAAGIARKRAVNLTLNTGLVAEAKLLSPNLSATVESLLEGFVAREHEEIGRAHV